MDELLLLPIETLFKKFAENILNIFIRKGRINSIYYKRAIDIVTILLNKNIPFYEFFEKEKNNETIYNGHSYTILKVYQSLAENSKKPVTYIDFLQLLLQNFPTNDQSIYDDFVKLINIDEEVQVEMYDFDIESMYSRFVDNFFFLLNYLYMQNRYADKEEQKKISISIIFTARLEKLQKEIEKYMEIENISMEEQEKLYKKYVLPIFIQNNKYDQLFELIFNDHKYYNSIDYLNYLIEDIINNIEEKIKKDVIFKIDTSEPKKNDFTQLYKNLINIVENEKINTLKDFILLLNSIAVLNSKKAKFEDFILIFGEKVVKIDNNNDQITIKSIIEKSLPKPIDNWKDYFLFLFNKYKNEKISDRAMMMYVNKKLNNNGQYIIENPPIEKNSILKMSGNMVYVILMHLLLNSKENGLNLTEKIIESFNIKSEIKENEFITQSREILLKKIKEFHTKKAMAIIAINAGVTFGVKFVNDSILEKFLNDKLIIFSGIFSSILKLRNEMLEYKNEKNLLEDFKDNLESK